MYLENLTSRNGSFARSMQGVLLAMAVVIVAGCTVAPELPEPPQVIKLDPPVPLPIATPLEISVLHKANYNPFERDIGKSFKALGNAVDYRSELALHSIETPKPVDFSTSQVLVSSVGKKPGGGYSVAVEKLEEIDDRILARIVLINPGPNCINTQAETFPFEFVIIPSRKPIEIFERQRTDDC